MNSGCSTCPLCRKRAPSGCDLGHWVFKCTENALARKTILGNLKTLHPYLRGAYSQIITLLEQPILLNQLTENEVIQTVNTLVIGPDTEHRVFKCDPDKEFSERNRNYESVRILYDLHAKNMTALKSTWVLKSAKKCHKLYERWALEREQHCDPDEEESGSEEEREEEEEA